MTRINCIPPAELRDKHLLAEYRELPRVFKLAHAAFHRGDDPMDFPGLYTLGKGHVRFFYDKLGWLKFRHEDLVAEMHRRGWEPKHLRVPAIANNLPPSWWGFWHPTADAITINRERIRQRTPIPTVR